MVTIVQITRKCTRPQINFTLLMGMVTIYEFPTMLYLRLEADMKWKSPRHYNYQHSGD
jgi:hypothetical protein